MKKIILLLLTIFLITAASGKADYSVYPNGGLVIDVIPEDNIVIFEDGSGLTWSFYGVKNYEVGDLVACVFWDAGTPNIFDDEILDVRYIGYIEQFE